MSSILSRLTSSRSSRASSTTMSSNPMAGVSTTTVPSTTLGTSVTSLPLSTNTALTSSSTSEGVPMHEPIDQDILDEVAGMLVIDSRGNQIPFGRIYEYQRTVVVFIRHFFCGMCASYVQALAKVPTDLLDAAGTKIVLIGCGAWDMIPTYQDTTKFRGLVYSDPTCKLHDMFGMVSDLIVPPKNERSIRSYVPRRYGKAVRKGIVEGLKQPINAMTGRYGPIPQLGGDFILGPGNVCTYAHRMKNTMDHLEVYDLMALADVQLPPPPLSPPSHRPKNKRSQHSISYSSARPLMGDVEEDYGACTLPPRHTSKASSSGINLWSSSASTKSAGNGAHTPARRRSPSHASTSNVARPTTSTNATTATTTTSNPTPLEERWNARPVSMILRGTGSESDLMYRAHQGLGVSAAVSAGIGGPGVVSGGYGYYDVGEDELAGSQAAGGGGGGAPWYSYAGGEGKEKEGYWKKTAVATGGVSGMDTPSGSGTDSSRGKKRQPNPFSAVSIPVQSVPTSGLVPSPTTATGPSLSSARPGTASGILGERFGFGKGRDADRPNTALGTRRPEMRSLSTTSSSAIPVLKKNATPKKLKRSSTTTAVPTLITTTPSATSALTIPAGPPQFMATSPSSASTSPPFSPTTPTTASSPSRSPPTSPLKSPVTKKRSLTTSSSQPPPITGLGSHPPLSPSHSFALSFSSQAPSTSSHHPPLPPPSPMTLPSANSSSPPTPAMSSSPPRGAVNAKIIDPAELLSADLDSWANLRSTSASSRPTTAGGSSSIRSVILGEDGSASGAVVVPPPPASIGRRMRQMSLSDGTGNGR